MRRSRASAAGLLALLLAGARPAAGDWVGERLCADGLQQGGEFGSAVAVGNDGTIAVGDSRHDVVVLFRRDSEGRCTRQAIPGRAGEGFGFALAIDGDRLLIGAPQSGGTGAVYLYDLSTGGLETVAVPEALRGDEVGSAVAISGGKLAVGARGADKRRGRVYAGSQGALTAISIPGGLAPRAELGQSVALSGNTLVIGAPSPYRGSGSPGASWVVDLGTRIPVPLTPRDRIENEAAYGYAVAVDGDRILAGAPLADSLHRDAGAVFEFRRQGTGWAQGPDLDLPGNPGDQLGVAIAVDGERAVVGARYASNARGEAYIVDLRDRTSQPLAQQVDVPAGAQFGFSVAARGGIVTVGAFRERGTGAAYRFEATVTVGFAAASSAVLESAGTAPLQVIVRGSASRLSAPVTVDLAILDGTATRNVDFSFDESRPYVIPAGTRTGEPYTLAEVEILPNAPPEEPETFQVQLSARPPALTGAPSVHEVTIQESLLVISGGSLETSEAGISAPLKVRLAAKPDSKVVVSLRTSDPTEGTVSPARLTFTPETWESEQTVQVTGQDDPLCDGDQAYEIRVTTASEAPRVIPALNADDERACLSAAMEVCTDGGGTVVYTIVLTNSAFGVLDAPAELLDLLPPEVSVVNTSADKGVATADPIANSVRWTGPMPGGSAVTITIVTALDELPGLGVTNQAEVTYDRDGRGNRQTVRTNEAVLEEGDVCGAEFR